MNSSSYSSSNQKNKLVLLESQRKGQRTKVEGREQRSKKDKDEEGSKKDKGQSLHIVNSSSGEFDQFIYSFSSPLKIEALNHSCIHAVQIRV